MTGSIAPTIVVLWEHELRIAAKSLAPFARAKDQPPTGDEMFNAIKACFAALYSPELIDGESPVTVMACRETISISKTEIIAPKS